MPAYQWRIRARPTKSGASVHRSRLAARELGWSHGFTAALTWRYRVQSIVVQCGPVLFGVPETRSARLQAATLAFRFPRVEEESSAPIPLPAGRVAGRRLPVVLGGRGASAAAPPAGKGAPTPGKAVFFTSDGLRQDLVAKYAAQGVMPTMGSFLKNGTSATDTPVKRQRFASAANRGGQ